ncbi:sensor histidine kinase [Streptomyces sp. NPDC088768]|uniref:sensor histidine kinase n=1 Tax=Streptomyces sp. NPDC088768 TaxID=3365894 RepID=UPI00382CF9CE
MAPADRPEPALSALPAHRSAGAALDRRWDAFHRWGPLALLAVSLAASALTGPTIMTPGEQRAVLWYAGGAVLLEVWALRARPARGAAGSAYYFLRWGLSFALTWCNPFLSVYAVIGYFGAGRYLPGRLPYAGMLLTAVVMAGANSGGFPLGSWGLVAFPVMYALHVGLCAIFWHLSLTEERQARAQRETIDALEEVNERLAAALAENAGLQEQLLVQAREAGIADERRRLAAEIHDTLAQGLTGVITQLQAATASAEPGAARAHIDRAAALARHGLGEARRSVRDLAPAALEHDGLPEALTKTVRTWAARTGIDAACTVTGTPVPLRGAMETTLLRITEEALANAARHSGAARLGVTLSYMDTELALDVRDDGKGFDPARPPRPDHAGGYGLTAMRSRAERLGGTLAVESEPGGGTAISARVPVGAREPGEARAPVPGEARARAALPGGA